VIRYFKLAVIVLIIAASGTAFAYIKLLGPPIVIIAEINKKSLKLELAATNRARQKGLMHRKQLAPLDGMLFQFPTTDNHSFWMKNTLIPLDMIFVDASHRIVYIAANTTPHSLTPIASGQPVTTIIEIEGGRSARDGITVGDKVNYEIPATVVVE
jgi:uncharacterized membrane protein (UPF0127 family)